MKTLLVRNAAWLVSMDDADHRWENGSIYIVDTHIDQIGNAADLPQHADTIIDAQGLILLPGLINTHHHFVQNLTRNVPGTQDVVLFDWLRRLYPIWQNLTPEAFRISARTAIAELMLSGCTTSSDHTYLFPNGARLDDQIEAAVELGFRFHAARGSMSLGESQGGLPPDSLVEDEEFILRDTRRLIEQYHDPGRYAMLRIVNAPCSPFNVTHNLFRESLALARSYGVHSHTHLAETLDEEDYCLERFGRRPIELIEDLGWVGPDIWHAHMVHPSASEIERLGHTQTGVAHCPCSNMRLASGIAPVGALVKAGARVGLGVDGSASNDGGHMLNEARQAMLLQRVGGNPAAMNAYEAIRLATRGGAAVLGRDDIGALAPGMAADIVGFRLDTLALAGGAVHDPLAALVFCFPGTVHLSIINGQERIRNGTLLGLELPLLIENHNRIARALVRGE